ncbi:MAG: ABC transporter substrate-binding protein [Deltaproteobacteria bacterium]|nr:ABC transporter substrate-binding protein [Deltaproteobacteria bacterium]
MKLLKVIALGNLAFFLALAFARAQERPVLVNVSIPSLSMDQAPYVIAREKGFFRQEGIEPRFILMHSAIASKALVSKDVDFNTSGSPTVNAAVAGLPIRAVFANGSRTEMYLIGAKGIHSFEDLKGKKVGIGGIGGLADVGTKRFLKAKGIGPKEVTYIVLGGSAVRMAGIVTGSVAAAPLSPPRDYLARKSGLNVLGYLGEAFPSYMGGLGVHVDALNERSRLVKGFVKASLKGLKFMHARKAETVELMMQFMRMNDREMVEAVYDSSIHAHTKDGLLAPDTQSEIIGIALEGMGRSGQVRPEAVFDLRLVREAFRELEAAGWKP